MGKLFKKTHFYYNKKLKVKADVEDGIAFKDYEGKKTDTYEYKRGLLSKWFSSGKLYEEYKYDKSGNLIGKRVKNT